MMGPVAVTASAASLPPRPEAKLANAAEAAGIDARSGAFSELFSAINGAAEAPGNRERDDDAARDENTEATPLPIPMFPEKTPQARFAEGLTATLPPELVQGNFAFAPPPAEVAPPVNAEAAKAVLPMLPPASGGPSAPPLAASEAGGQMPAAFPDAAPEPMPATPSVPPASAPAIPIRSPQERNAAKPLPQDGSAPGEPSATATIAADALAAPGQTATSDNRPGQDGGRSDPARALAAQKEAKVSVVLQETYFAPAPQQSPAMQIANRIIADVDLADPVFTAQLADVPKDAAAAPLKVLQIQLDPPELGALTIRLSLKNDTLNMQIEAGRRETARLIERDQDALSGMLRSAGYNMDGLTVQVTTSDRGSGAQQQFGGGGFNPPAGQHPAERQAQQGDARQSWQSDVAPAPIVENGRETEAPGADRLRGGPVYL